MIFEKCGTVLRFRKDEIVIEEGQSHARIFHIVRGRCRVETEDEVLVDGVVTRQRQIVGVCGVGEMFGEKTFLFGGSATASVYADSNEGDTEVRKQED